VHPPGPYRFYICIAS
uniref:Uncharacterized protein n=1 Tax=Strongyloides venezuelensis TaxID=75913 RepID=A0A0K0G651_STRVS